MAELDRSVAEMKKNEKREMVTEEVRYKNFLAKTTKINKMEVQFAKIVITNEIDLTEKKAKIRERVSHKEWLEMTEPEWQQYQDRFDKFLLDRGLPQVEVDYGWMERLREMDRRQEAVLAEKHSAIVVEAWRWELRGVLEYITG